MLGLGSKCFDRLAKIPKGLSVASSHARQAFSYAQEEAAFAGAANKLGMQVETPLAGMGQTTHDLLLLAEREGAEAVKQAVTSVAKDSRVVAGTERNVVGAVEKVAKEIVAKNFTLEKKHILKKTKLQTIKDIVEYVKISKGAPKNGYKGGGIFANDGRGGSQILPARDVKGNTITYKEYDILPYQKGINRGTERVVIGSDGNIYYTSDHYKTFTKIRMEI